MEITKIKFKDGRIEINYTTKFKTKDESNMEVTHENEFTLKSTEKPAPEFDLRLQALAEDVCQILELPEDYVNGITVSGVSFSYSGGVMGAVITASKKLLDSNSPFNINTPFKPSEQYNEKDDSTTNLLSDDTVGKLEALIYEAEKYISGKRAQLNLEQLLKDIEIHDKEQKKLGIFDEEFTGSKAVAV